MTHFQAPRVLMIGAGRFGTAHLRTWRAIEAEGGAVLAGVVVRTPQSQQRVTEAFGIPCWTRLEDVPLDSVDAVDVVTPPDTHIHFVSACLPHAHVLVEKPLAADAREAAELQALAQRSRHVLMVGHIYRFHPVTRQLKRIVSEISELPLGVSGRMLNPVEDMRGRADAGIEFMHLFDVIDFLFDEQPDICIGAPRGHMRRISLQYPGPMNVVLTVGWGSRAKVRSLTLSYADRDIHCNYEDNSIVTTRRNHRVDKIFFPREHVSLAAEFRAFLAATREAPSGRMGAFPGADVGRRMVDIAVRAVPPPPSARPRVGVIGGGIFGATCAIELAHFCDVTLYERQSHLLTGVTYNNQWRHHSGFHYPRSYDQIQEIRTAKPLFEAVYGDAVVTDHPAYFCTSATGIEIPAERYLAACRSNELNFRIEDPPAGVLDQASVSLSLLSDEAIYDVPRLQRLVRDRLAASGNIELLLDTDVIDGVLATDGSKRLIARGLRGIDERSFDYVINATYANRNLLAKWFRFPVEPLRFDVYELLVLRLPIDPICVTIMDGPFTSLVTMGHDNLFMLSHIQHSVLKSVITDDGLSPRWGPIQSNRGNMLHHSRRYLPILEKAEVVESRFATRAVNAYAKDFDARPTVVDDHGFGCWSILGGKILTCVKDAREIAAAIRAEQHRESPALAPAPRQ